MVRQSDSDDTPAPFVRLIGSVQDGGFPHAACSGTACSRARREGRSRKVAALALVLPRSGKVFLFDATPDVREQLEDLADVRAPLPNGVDRAPIDGVFLSHAHMGHYLGLAFFGYEAIHTRDLPIYATPSMSRFLASSGPWSQLVGQKNISMREIAPGTTVDLEDGVSVTFVSSPHRDEYTDTVGFLIRGPSRGLLYVPDTDTWDRWSPSIEAWLAQVDVAILDGTFYSSAELPNRAVKEIGHPLVTRSMDRFERLLPESLEVVFAHMNHSNPILLEDSPERAVVEQRGFTVGAEGAEYPL